MKNFQFKPKIKNNITIIEQQNKISPNYDEIITNLFQKKDTTVSTNDNDSESRIASVQITNCLIQELKISPGENKNETSSINYVNNRNEDTKHQRNKTGNLPLPSNKNIDMKLSNENADQALKHDADQEKKDNSEYSTLLDNKENKAKSVLYKKRRASTSELETSIKLKIVSHSKCNSSNSVIKSNENHNNLNNQTNTTSFLKINLTKRIMAIQEKNSSTPTQNLLNTNGRDTPNSPSPINIHHYERRAQSKTPKPKPLNEATLTTQNYNKKNHMVDDLLDTKPNINSKLTTSVIKSAKPKKKNEFNTHSSIYDKFTEFLKTKSKSKMTKKEITLEFEENCKQKLDKTPKIKNSVDHPESFSPLQIVKSNPTPARTNLSSSPCIIVNEKPNLIKNSDITMSKKNTTTENCVKLENKLKSPSNRTESRLKLFNNSRITNQIKNPHSRSNNSSVNVSKNHSFNIVKVEEFKSSNSKGNAKNKKSTDEMELNELQTEKSSVLKPSIGVKINYSANFSRSKSKPQMDKIDLKNFYISTKQTTSKIENKINSNNNSPILSNNNFQDLTNLKTREKPNQTSFDKNNSISNLKNKIESLCQNVDNNSQGLSTKKKEFIKNSFIVPVVKTNLYDSIDGSNHNSNCSSNQNIPKKFHKSVDSMLDNSTVSNQNNENSIQISQSSRKSESMKHSRLNEAREKKMKQKGETLEDDSSKSVIEKALDIEKINEKLNSICINLKTFKTNLISNDQKQDSKDNLQLNSFITNGTSIEIHNYNTISNNIQNNEQLIIPTPYESQKGKLINKIRSKHRLASYKPNNTGNKN